MAPEPGDERTPHLGRLPRSRRAPPPAPVISWNFWIEVIIVLPVELGAVGDDDHGGLALRLVAAELEREVLREMQLVSTGRFHSVMGSVVIGRADAGQSLEIRVCRFQPGTMVPGAGCDRYVRRGNGHASRASATRKVVCG